MIDFIKNKTTKLNRFSLIFVSGLIIFLSIVFYNWKFPLEGIHRHRQADTLFAAYSYCTENGDFLKPKIAHRENTSGVAIGEFPLFSILVSSHCKLGMDWNEGFAKGLSLFCFALSALLWGLIVQSRLQKKLEWSLWFIIYFFIPLNLTHLSVPIPDALALVFMGMAGYLWSLKSELKEKFALVFFIVAIICSFLSFMIRPYLIPLIFFVTPIDLKLKKYIQYIGIQVTLMFFGYLFWYKNWINQSEIQYYATELRTLQELMVQIPKAIPPVIWQIIRNHLSIFGCIPFIYGAVVIYRQKFFNFKSFKLIHKIKYLFENYFVWILWLFSILMVLLGKGTHVINHNYYLFAAGTLSVVLLAEGLSHFNLKWKTFMALGIVLNGLLSSYYLWNPKYGETSRQIEQIVKELQIKSTDKIATYRGDVPITLYLAKRTGWMLFSDSFKGSCPQGASFYILEKDPGRITGGSCPSVAQ